MFTNDTKDQGKKRKRKKGKHTPSEKNTHKKKKKKRVRRERERERERERRGCSLRTQRLQNNRKPQKNTHQNTNFFKKREWKCGCTYVANWEPLRALSCAAPLVAWIRKRPKNTKKTFRPPSPPPKQVYFHLFGGLLLLLAIHWLFMRKLGLLDFLLVDTPPLIN